MDGRSPKRGIGGESDSPGSISPFKKSKMAIPTKYEGVFVADLFLEGRRILCTKSIVPCGEDDNCDKGKIVSIENPDGTKNEYRIWGPRESNLAAAIANRFPDIWIKPGARVLYLGAGIGTTVYHVSDIVGPEGMVYAVEISEGRGEYLSEMAEKRTNVTPIIGDASDPLNYKTLIDPRVDVIYSDIAHSHRFKILLYNALYFLKGGGQVLMRSKAYYQWETDDVMAKLSAMLRAEGFKWREHLVLDPFKPIEIFSMWMYEREQGVAS